MPSPPMAAVIVPLLVTPPSRTWAPLTKMPLAAAPLTEMTPLLLTEPWIVVLTEPLALENAMPFGAPGEMVPALTTLPETVAPLKVTQAVAPELVKLATAPGPTTFAHAAIAGRAPPPMSSAATDDDAKR